METETGISVSLATKPNVGDCRSLLAGERTQGSIAQGPAVVPGTLGIRPRHAQAGLCRLHYLLLHSELPQNVGA